ncbi:hypothetical protein [Emticicia sp. C21]|uniref:hypothetical protein n=1 Tax=Emticicia sp. C21 TaxID=2302915 RepID=UPI000E81EE45|nr:hypothetical protein [Emticicia sp. C21]RFS17099.1 hypothetical protein D0T08_10520 [Emticicia sp. C21]
MEKDFIIIKASWETHRERNYDSFAENQLTYSYYNSLITFLQEQGLTTRKILSINEKANDNTCIKKSDLKEEGYLLFKKKYIDKWVDLIFDGKRQPTDIKYLEKSLEKIRNQ